MVQTLRWGARLWMVLVLTAVVGCAAPRHQNAYPVPEDTGERVPPSYFLHRAWVQITRDLRRTEVPPVVALDLPALAGRAFAVSWLGHSSLLVRAGSQWVLIDPVFSGTAGPVQGLGPARLTALPLAPDALPRIDVVLITHDHYDHLDLATVRRLARQAGGAPRFLVGQGLGAWFTDAVQTPAQEFAWWQSLRIGDTGYTFVPAQHNSGRSPWARNQTLWGGWVVEHGGQRLYHAGDTAYVAPLFAELRARIGPIDLAALPIGAYLPRQAMRFEHTDPDEAVQAFQLLGAQRAFGIHWGTFQLGDDEPFQPAHDLAEAVRKRHAAGFGLSPIGAVLDIAPTRDATPTALRPPAALVPAFARP